MKKAQGVVEPIQDVEDKHNQLAEILYPTEE